jgi:O-acetyl-ADP-ribose deacetylase (regulator of RNase III)
MTKQMPTSFWTNSSVLALSGDHDPVEAISTKARNLVFRALELGWKGPPFDPFELADLLTIQTVPNSEVLDAKTIPVGANRFRVEFNPDRPYRRIRYSIFHEIAHTLFPDCAQTIRNRGIHNATKGDDWQLETLCNLAAAEFLLPTGALGTTGDLHTSVDTVLELRKRYEASAEAALLRIRRLTTEQAMAFSCHRERVSGRYIIEYAIPTPNSDWSLRPGALLPNRSAAEECTAIGYTAKQTERWPRLGEVDVECVGIAPLPHDVYPRVIGFARPLKVRPINYHSMAYVRGDATQTRGTGPKLILQIVNDAAFTWGGHGFAAAIKRRWPSAQQAFTAQVSTERSMLRLGSVVICEVEHDISLGSLVAQHGYGKSPHPRIRYGALRECLLKVSEIARRQGATVHAPRIGSGEAGGSWAVVEEIIDETLVKVGVKVLVYDLPQGKEKPKAQTDLAFSA